jgi:signal transduction histidine kinase
MRRWPLHRLLIFAFVALTFAAAVPVAAFNAVETRSLLHELTAARLELPAQETAASIDETLRALEWWGRVFERGPGARRLIAAGDPDNPARADWEEEMLEVVREAERLSGIFIARPDGVRLAGAGRLNVPEDLGSWTPFRRAVADEMVVWPRGLGGIEPQVLVLVPLHEGDSVVAVMGVADDMGTLGALVRHHMPALTPGTKVTLLDEHGVRLLSFGRGDLEGVATRPLPPDIAAELVREGRLRPGAPVEPEGMFGPAYEGVRIPLSTVPWTYVVSVPTARFEAPARRQLLRVVVGSLAAALAALALAPLFARRLSQPFEALEAALQAWGRGERGVRAAPSATQEGERLSAAFDKMAEDIEAYERSLQDKVAERTAQLETAHRELELFTYSASHDLRTPLRAIDGFTSCLLEDEPLSPDARDMLERTAAAVDRMNRLIDALLQFGRVSRHALTRERVDVTTLAREVGAEFLAAAPERDVRLTVADGLVAVADPVLLRRVFENLLGNACKYTKNKPDARVEVGVTAEATPAFFVRDNGAGFDMSHAGKLFTPFTRLHSSSEFPGTGIGLATVQRIVERHGGRIWAVAEPDRGATFYFTLPGAHGLS